ncbi:MAG: Non-specific serine/threonine protein kinase [Gemmataceae bacterium]|nr:Non-specific serine/threonine protein kinase [Gemmataceae bacterium]
MSDPLDPGPAMPPTDPKPKKKLRRRDEQPKVSRTAKPEGMSLEEWQTYLRRQFGRDQKFLLKNLGGRAAFSDFLVTNPQSRGTYRVTIRGTTPGDNTCTCPDFTTNTLGTCKHIEFVLARLERGKAAKAGLKAGYRPESGEVFLRYGARREVCFVPPADAPPALAKLAARFFDPAGRLKPDTAAGVEGFIGAATELDPDLRVADDAWAFLAELRDAAERTRRVAEAFPKGARSAAFDDLLKVPLYDYQREGVLFAARAGRCLLGDEMGLGKTAQAIAAAEVMARLFGVERVLVVCPTSLKHQWKGEIGRFTARPVRVVEGQRLRRAEAFADPAPFFKVTNYDTVHMDLDAIAGWGPDLVILDEAQRIKNWATRVARSVKTIRSPYAAVLTGTPLENRLEELVSIVDFVDRHRLGPTFRLLHDHQVRDSVGKVTGYRDLDRIGQTLAPVLLRRQKDQVLDQLPERIENTVFVPMTPYQRDLHTENQEEVARLVAKWRRFKFLTEADKQRLMAALQNMRMACDSSYLLDPKTDHGLKTTEIMTVLGEVLERPGAKAVVFSQWLRMHDLLVRAAKKRKWGHVFFHGGVDGRDRGKLVDRFRADPGCRLFFSTDAGGVGLNLQFASVVVNVDLPWNPAVLEQRIGRVHRLGQRQPVRVVNFVSKGTIEEGMLSVLKFKKGLFAGVLDGGEANIDMGGTRLNKFMETVEATTTGIPPVPPAEREDAVEAKREFGGKPRTPADAAAPTAADPWAAFLQAGAALLQQVAGAGQTGAGSLVRKDEQTGETYLRLPVPSEAVLTEALSVIGGLLNGLRR